MTNPQKVKLNNFRASESGVGHIRTGHQLRSLNYSGGRDQDGCLFVNGHALEDDAHIRRAVIHVDLELRGNLSIGDHGSTEVGKILAVRCRNVRGVVIIVGIRDVSLPRHRHRFCFLKNAGDYIGGIKLVGRDLCGTIQGVVVSFVVQGTPQVILSGVIVFIRVSNVGTLRHVERCIPFTVRYGLDPGATGISQ